MADCNNAWFARRAQWLRTIAEKYPDFAEWTVLPLLNEEDPFMTGFQSPIDAAVLKQEMKEAKKPGGFAYGCGGSFGMFDLQPCLTPSVPILESKVKELKESIKLDGSQLPFTLDAAMETKTSQFKVFQKASPDEMYDAVLWAFSDVIENGKAADIKKFLRTLRSIPLRIYLLPTWDKKYAHTHNLRTSILNVAAAVEQTCIQEVADVASFYFRKVKEIGRAIGAKELSALYREDLKVMFKAGKERSDGMIDSSITINKTMLSDPRIRDIAIRIDSKFSGTLSVFKMQDLISAHGSSQKKILWFLECLEDTLLLKKKLPGEVTSKSE